MEILEIADATDRDVDNAVEARMDCAEMEEGRRLWARPPTARARGTAVAWVLWMPHLIMGDCVCMKSPGRQRFIFLFPLLFLRLENTQSPMRCICQGCPCLCNLEPCNYSTLTVGKVLWLLIHGHLGYRSCGSGPGKFSTCSMTGSKKGLVMHLMIITPFG